MKTHLTPENNCRQFPVTFAKKIRCLFLLAGCFSVSLLHSQADKRLVLAEQYFNAGDYYTAASLYGQFLKPDIREKSRSDFPLNANRNNAGRTGKYGSHTDILFKQAESYRLANYWKEAAALYQACFQKDSLKYGHALYWLAVCHRSVGLYNEAEKAVDRFLAEFASDNHYQQEAKLEKQTIAFIKKELTRPDQVLYHVQKLNSSHGNEKGFFAPALSPNGMLISSTMADSVATGSDPYHNRLFTADLSGDGLQNFMPLQIEGLDATMNQGAASLSTDGNHLYFTQWKKENGKTVSAIYHSKKTGNGWSQPMLLMQVNQQGSNSKQPFISADGQYLFFASDRKGGQGGFDIWYAKLRPDGTASEPENAGNTINTRGHEQSPFYHAATGALVFASDRKPGMGGYDLYLAKGLEGQWMKAENMGYPINSSRDDLYFFSAGEENILDKAYFSSDRGSECCLATYAVSKTPKKKMITGFVMDCNDINGLAGVEVRMKDAAGNILQTITAEDGSYRFPLNSKDQPQFTAGREGYEEKSASLVIESINETEWHTDTIHNAPICLDKKKLVIKVENVVTVYFDFDRHKLTDAARAKLDSIYHVLMEDTAATIQISGYTDGLGSEAYNKKLSDKRAKACADYLIKKGIDAGRISFESFGACCPVEMELINGRDNPDGRSMNRRALINISRSTEE